MKHGGNVWQGEIPSEWLDYSANLRPEGTPDWVKKAMIKGMENARYYPDPTMKRAKAALSEYLGIDADCILPTAGGISAIQLANKLSSGETILLTPCFCEYEQFATSPIRKVSLLKATHEIVLPEMLDLKENGLVWLCNPMNPVGCAFTKTEIETLLHQIESQNSYLVVDEAFIEYCPEHSVVDLIAKHDRLLITGSMTKILGIPGVRLGYLCAQPQVLDELKAHQLTWELSCFAEAVALALPEHKAEVQAYSVCNTNRRKGLVSGLEALGIHVYPSQSACVLADFGRPVDAISEALKARKILVRSCMSFDDINDGCHLRLAVKDEASNQILIDTLREVLQCAEKA